MLLDAHGGAVAARGHGLRCAAAPGVMGLLLLRGGAGRPLGERRSRPGRLLCCGVFEALFLRV